VNHTLLASTTADLLEFMHDPMATVATGGGLPVAILHHNAPIFYCVPTAA
jgi:antitoxin StbD